VDPDFIVRLPDGHHAAIAMSWTDYALPNCCHSPPTPTHLLDFQGLRQAAQLIEHILQQENITNRSEE
jgi:diaminopimelate decarboxylase